MSDYFRNLSGSGINATPGQVSFSNVRFSIGSRFRFLTSMILVLIDSGAVISFTRLSSLSLDELDLCCAVVVFISVAQICGLYDMRSSVDLRRAAIVALAVGLLLSCTIAIAGWQASGQNEGQQLCLAMVCAVLVATLGRLVAALIIVRMRHRFIERVAVVGMREASAAFARVSRVLNDEVSVAGWFAIDDDKQGGAMSPWSDVTQPGRERATFLHAMPINIDRVLVLKAGLADGMLDELADLLQFASVSVHVITRSGQLASDGYLQTCAGWVLHERPISPRSMLLKRAIDVTMAIFGLLLIAPVFFGAALAIRAETPGPVLFRQKRLGRGNAPFTVLKFRTMHTDAPGGDGSVQAVRGDPRVTRVGMFLRKTSLDELPQLINVLQGTMSLVGPRPHPTELNHRFVPLIENYSARHRMAPGITGWAQVNGFRGETRTVEQMRRRVELDLEYIRCHSVAFDLWILIRTVGSVLRPRNAY